MPGIKETRVSLDTKAGKVELFKLSRLTELGLPQPQRLPFSIKVLLESALRHCDGDRVTMDDVKKIASWKPKNASVSEIAFKPGRVILQDFTGVPCLVDLAAMRSAMQRLGGDYNKINPQVRCDLVIDHSVQVDAAGSPQAMQINVDHEFKRNNERYEFLKWGQKAFRNFSVVPPATGIVHQVNLEYLARGVLTQKTNGTTVAFPDSLVGTDSHTTMINGLGIVGWGVGGIEAEAVMLGEPIYMLLPEVIGVKLTGILAEGVTATDLVLTVTQILRQKGVVGKFVEFYGEGLSGLALPDRATISNMAPEYGATTGIFPVDNETLRYYRMTARQAEQIDLIERYMKEQGMFYTLGDPAPEFSDTVDLDLSSVIPSLAGPKRPQDRVALCDMKTAFRTALTAPLKERGFALAPSDLNRTAPVSGDRLAELRHGSLAIAAITSCTNTSNPSILLAAGLVAQKAVEKGLTVPSYVKTSFAPGSQVVEEYMRAAGLMPALEALGFHIVGYGCTTCIGNSGPLPENISAAIEAGNLVAASVLSGNRNFEGRVNPYTKANYLASPPLVVAFALAGRADIDLTTEPLGKGRDRKDVFLKDIWPTRGEIADLITKHVTAEAFRERYKNVSAGNALWNAIDAGGDALFDWKNTSTYVQEPPFFTSMKKEPDPIAGITGARVLVWVGDSTTTDHISPAGTIAKDSPAGTYLQNEGVRPADFNSYGSRRGNDRVMTRGTFANIRLRNLLAPGTEGSWTVHWPDGEKMRVFDAAQRYAAEKVPLLVLAGKEYGTGSSRDWAAKGTALLGVRAVLAQSYERIHRSNLAGMGVLPLEFTDSASVESLGLTGEEVFDFSGINEKLKPRQTVAVTATARDGSKKTFQVLCRLDTPVEIDYFRHGGILQTVLRKLLT